MNVIGPQATNQGADERGGDEDRHRRHDLATAELDQDVLAHERAEGAPVHVATRPASTAIVRAMKDFGRPSQVAHEPEDQQGQHRDPEREHRHRVHRDHDDHRCAVGRDLPHPPGVCSPAIRSSSACGPSRIGRMSSAKRLSPALPR